MERKIKILLVDDHTMVRKGIRLMLESQDRFLTSIQECDDGFEVLKLIKEQEFDLVLMDISMPKIDGIETLRRIRNIDSELPVLIMTMHKDEKMIKTAYAIGANGYILKNAELYDLSKAILTAVKGEKYYASEITNILFSETQTKSKLKKEKEGLLSKRELEVLQKILEEKTNHEIADELCLSHRTIEAHRKRILEKLGVETTVGLVKFALRNGLDTE